METKANQIKNNTSSSYHSKLYVAIKTLVKKDNTELRQAIFKRYIAARFVRGAAINSFKVLPNTLGALLISLYNCKCLGSVPTKEQVGRDDLILWENPTELKEILSLNLSEDIQNSRISFTTKRFFSNLGELNFSDIKRFYKLNKLLNKRYSLLNSLRVGELVCFRYLIKNRLNNLKKIYLSSDASPFSMAIVASQKNNFETHYVPHGIIPPADYLLLFDYCKFKSAYNMNLFEGRMTGESQFIGNKTFPEFDELKKGSLVIGVVCSIIPHQQNILKLVRKLKEIGHSVIFKTHPNIMGSKDFFNKLNVSERLTDCDLVLCGNSGHAIKILNQSIPIVYSSDLDYAPYDIYQLVEKGILYELDDVNRLQDCTSFYNHAEWKDKWKNI